MAQEPQGSPPQPLRLQPDYLRLRAEQKALLSKARGGHAESEPLLAAKDQEVLEYIRAHKGALNG
jgi:uncharacterized membrane protein